MVYYCLLNDDKRFIACVDPKCGCTTVKDWFNHTLPVPDPDFLYNVNAFRIPAETVADHDSHFRLLFVRDPLRRLVSFYNAWVVRDNERWCFADDAREVPLHQHTFREFLQALSELGARGAAFQHHLTPQMRTVRDVRFDEVVKLEELDQRMVAINRRLGVSYAPRRLNAHDYAAEERPGAFDLSPSELRAEPAPPFASFFDDELESLARSLYRDDVRFYDSL